MLRDGFARHTPVLANKSAVRLVIADTALLPHVGELLAQMTDATQWLEVNDPVADIIESAFQTITEYYNMSLIGMVTQFIGAVPDGWLPLDGDTHAEDDYPELFAVLPSSMKSGSNFTLPDMTDSFSMGTNTPAEIGDTGGENTSNLTVGQLPSHTHTYIPPILNIDIEGVGVPDITAAGVGISSNTGATGTGDDIENRPTFIKVLIAVYAGRI